MIKHTVLIVDDDPAMLDSLSRVLELDFNVLTAFNGREGLTLFKSIPSISVILLDLDMPVMNGVEMLTRVREISKDVNVIIITGKSCHDYAKRCANLNVQRYVEKPFDVETLIEQINTLIGEKEYKVLKEMWGDDYETKWASMSSIVRKVLQLIEYKGHIYIQVKKLAASQRITPSHLERIFRKDCEMRVLEYINKIRIGKCKELLATKPRLNIDEIAYALGFNDTSYFCRFFKKNTNLTPTEFRIRWLGKERN